MDVNQLTETAGKTGASFAEALAQKAIEAIDGFPTVGPNAEEQTAAVTGARSRPIGSSRSAPRSARPRQGTRTTAEPRGSASRS